jgi:serine/threonine protein phosphatase 1
MARYAIGDIHGCYKSFDALLERIALTRADEVYLLGDYIHRGPSSLKVIERILYLQKEGYQIKCLLGNHEEMAMPDLSIGARSPHLYTQLTDSFVQEIFKTYSEVPRQIIDFIDQLKTIVLLDDYILVHAGINFKANEPLTERKSMVWIRDWYADINRELLGNRIILHGHTPILNSTMEQQYQNMQVNGYLDLDGGCVFFNREQLGQLCALDMDHRLLIRQPNIESEYYEI